MNTFYSNLRVFLFALHLPKVIFILIFLFSSFLFTRAQTVFYTENFESNPCTSGCDPSFVGWSTATTGANSASPNVWYVSCSENGQAATVCGAGCGTDESLHIGSTTLGDIGAAFDASQTTNVRVQSPIINCTNYSTITLSFNYIMFGQAGIDYGSLLYHNGTTWSTLTNMAQTTCCGGVCNGFRQGRWTAFSTVLPASANNNPNIRIGFNWTNNNSSGSDPSFAIDDITLAYTTLLPVELSLFELEEKESNVFIKWLTESETNNDYFTIERSYDGLNFETIAIVDGNGNSNTNHQYELIDEHPLKGISYYRLKQTDFNGDYNYFPIRSVLIEDELESQLLVYPNPSTGEFTFDFMDDEFKTFDLRIVNTSGQIVFQKNIQFESELKINLKYLPMGLYFAEAMIDHEVLRKRIIISK